MIVWAFLSALCWAVAVYLWSLRRLPPPVKTAASTTKRADKVRAWSITRRSAQLLGWSEGKFRLASAVSAVLTGVLWYLLVQNSLAALFMVAIGWQLPGYWVEGRASKQLSRMQRQIALFVSTVHDHLHARGATVEDAMMAGVQSITEDPLRPAMQRWLVLTQSNVPFIDRLTQLERQIDLPMFSFFTTLIQIKNSTGIKSMAHAFDVLTEKLQDDERMQAMVQGELSLYRIIVVGGLLLDLAVFPGFRLLSPHWTIIHAHLGFFIDLAAVGSVVVFTGLRRFSQAGMTLGTASV